MSKVVLLRTFPISRPTQPTSSIRPSTLRIHTTKSIYTMPRDTTEEKARSESMGKEKRKPVRRDPEKRRQQNIRAQRRYREKLRERLENLETLRASLAQRSPMTGKIQSESILGDDVWDVSISSSSMATPKDCQQLLPQSDHTASALNIWTSATHLTSSDNTLSSPNVWDSILWDYTAQLSHSDISPSTLAISDSTRQFPPSEAPLSAPSIWVPPTHVNPSVLIHDKHKDGIDRCCMTTTTKCNCPTPHFKVQTHRAGPYSSTEVRILRIGPVTPTPDPYANHLRLDTICTLAAMDTLRMHISITEEMMCAKESPSPFYRSLRASADDMVKEDMICTVQRIFMTLKPDLRPSIEQITVKHPPYIDVLPFRTLRKNLILHQQEIDEDEFLRDAVTGLVCWGGAGVGRKDRDASTGYASTGTPWDNRSWEAKEWFLKKYWSLLGGDEGELVRQSEWWRSIRGEDPLGIEALA